MESIAAESPLVAPSTDVVASSTPPNSGLAVRMFPAHEPIESVVYSSSVDLVWTRAEAGQNGPSKSHSRHGALIILDGGATLEGSVSRVVRQGDVIALPARAEYGFTSVGSGGLHALHVSFIGSDHLSAQDVTSLDALLERNEIRAHLILNNPFFLLWREGNLDDERKQRTMLECLVALVDTFETLLPVQRELAHNDLARVERDSATNRDPVLRAISTWYCHQVLALDGPGKAAQNLVLETTGYYLGVLSGPILFGEAASRLETATERDAKLREICARLPAGQHPNVYAGLHGVLEDTWDMLDEATTRIAAFVTRES